ncbi:MAG: porin family protein [Bacteroidales bacterium]
MTTIRIILFIAILTVSFKANSQRFIGGLMAGLSTSQINGDTQQGFDKLGFWGGSSVEIEFSELAGFKIELYYVGKGAKKNSGGVEVFKTKLHYIEMPFLFTLKPTKKFEFDLGLTGSYLISSTLYENSAEVPDGLNDMHNFDFGAMASGTYFFSKHIGLNVRIEYSLIPVSNDPNWYNYNFSFGMVYLFNRTKSGK